MISDAMEEITAALDASPITPAAPAEALTQHVQVFGESDGPGTGEPLTELFRAVSNTGKLMVTVDTSRKQSDPAAPAEAKDAVRAEPVAWATHHDEPMLFPTRAEAETYCDDDEDPIPLYAHVAPTTLRQPEAAEGGQA